MSPVRPVCFMVMPFGTKDVPNPPTDAPNQIDFDALWNEALLPTIASAGFEPVRADQELGAMIIKEMIERLAWADLVVADLTIPNANVYYEVGVRHAARRDGCVLVAAEWSHAVFDLSQIRSLRYPYPKYGIDEASAKAIRVAIEPHIQAMAQGESPVWQSVPTYAAQVDGDPPASFRTFVERLSRFQARARAVQAAPRDQRAEKALELYNAFQEDTGGVVPAVALELLYLVRDNAGWDEALQLIEGLPDPLRGMSVVREQHALAVAKLKDEPRAIGLLTSLIQDDGDTPERSGLLGSCFKRLYRAAEDPIDQEDNLDQAIEAYARGMMLDLNAYYCASNLPLLYRARGQEDDETLALRAASIAMAACDKAEQEDRGSADEWLDPTILGIAFDLRDRARARSVLPKVAREPVAWKRETTRKDLEERLTQIPEPELRASFDALVERLRRKS